MALFRAANYIYENAKIIDKSMIIIHRKKYIFRFIAKE